MPKADQFLPDKGITAQTRKRQPQILNAGCVIITEFSLPFEQSFFAGVAPAVFIFYINSAVANIKNLALADRPQLYDEWQAIRQRFFMWAITNNAKVRRISTWATLCEVVKDLNVRGMNCL